MHPHQLTKQSEIDAYIRDQKAAHLAELEKAKNSNSWMLMGDETGSFDELPPVNFFLQEVFALRDIPEKLAAKSKPKILSLLKFMIHKDFDFLNLEHLLLFFQLSIQKNLLKSFVYENLVLNTLFHLFERNLGHKQFDSAAFLNAFIEIKDCLAQRRNSFAFQNKILARFARLFQKNFYFYLESIAVIERLANLLVDSFLESLSQFSKLLPGDKSGQFTQFCLNENCDFAGVVTRVLKPGVVGKFAKKGEFLSKLRVIVTLFPELEDRYRESPLVLTEFFCDFFATFNALLSFGYLHELLEVGHKALFSFDVFLRLVNQAVRAKKLDFLKNLFDKNFAVLCSRASLCNTSGAECGRLVSIIEETLSGFNIAKPVVWKEAAAMFEKSHSSCQTLAN